MSLYSHFRYTIPGRLLFMIMAGILAVSLGTDFGYVMCAVTITAAVYNAVVMSCYPDWTAKVRLSNQIHSYYKLLSPYFHFVFLCLHARWTKPIRNP
jgi:uncharacterized membrane protein